ncbi:hypothetical protein DEM28_07425 [Enterobacter mori]|nr:hypothetical protein DEM28_07425 [Enterobacter mori]
MPVTIKVLVSSLSKIKPLRKSCISNIILDGYMKLNKTLLAVVIASSTATAAHADINQAISLVDGLANKSISFSEGKTTWNAMDTETQKQARQYDSAQGTHYTTDYREGFHDVYDQNQRYSSQQVDPNAAVVAAHDIEAAKVKGHLLTNANIERTANQHPDYNAQVVAAHDENTYQVAQHVKEVQQIADNQAHMEQVKTQVGIDKTLFNQQRTANQHPDYNAQVVAAHDENTYQVAQHVKEVQQIADNQAHMEQVKTQVGIDKTLFNQQRTANQHPDYNAQVVAAHDENTYQVAQHVKEVQQIADNQAHMEQVKTQVGIDKTLDNQQRTSSQHTTQTVLTHQTATATPVIDRSSHLDAPSIDRSSHLDGVHQDIATPHLDGQHSGLPHQTATASPVVDRTEHLDSNATEQDRQSAKLNAVVEQTQVNSEAVKGLQLVQANQQRTSNQHVSEQPRNGVDGKNGKDGITTTVTKVQTDTKTQQRVQDNQTAIRHVEDVQTTQGEYVQHMNQTVSHNSTLAASNSQRLDSVESRQKSLEQQQSNDREEYRAGIAGAVAISGLHYTETDNSVAVGAGDFKNEQGYALGYRHKFSQNVAATVAASETSNGDAMFSASAAIGW